MTHDEIELVANRCRLELAKMGVMIRLVYDLNEIEHLYSKLDKTLSAAANHKRLLLTQKNCFAVFGMEGEEPVLGSVIRVDDLGNEDAQSFLSRSVETIFDVSVTRATSDVYKDQRWGRVAYFGDLKTIRRPGIGSKGEKIVKLASTYGHFRAFMDHNTNVHYCFLREADYRNVIPFGFLEASPYIWLTDKDLYEDGSPYYIGTLRVEKMPELAASMWPLLPDLFAVDQKPLFEVVTKNSTG